MGGDIQGRTELDSEFDSIAQSALDLARRLFQLEQRVDAYAKLYEEELADIREDLKEQSAQLLQIISKTQRNKTKTRSSSRNDQGDAI